MFFNVIGDLFYISKLINKFISKLISKLIIKLRFNVFFFFKINQWTTNQLIELTNRLKKITCKIILAKKLQN